MSRDIRSYFQRNTAKTSSNVAPVRTSKRRIISSDEDEEKTQSPIKRSKKTKTPEKKLISPVDIFGKGPITRQEAPKVLKTLLKEEAKLHNDEDFEAALCQLDTSDIEQFAIEIKEKAKTPVKNTQKTKEKKTPEKVDTEKTSKNESKQKNSKSGEHTEHKDLESKSKDKKKIRKKTLSDVYKIEIEHTEKKKVSQKKTESTDVFEEKIEKKKQSVAMYQQYLQRGGARHPGSKEIPVGAENCLAGLSFVITGVLDSLEREEADDLIKQYGGRILLQVSKKTDYVVLGDQPGPSKVAKANSFNIKQITEDDLLELIRTRPAGQAVKQSRTISKDRVKRKSTESEEDIISPKKAKLSVNEETKTAASIYDKQKSSNKNIEKSLKVTQEKKESHNGDAKLKSPIKNGNEESSTCNKKETNDIKDDTRMQTVIVKDINESEPVQALVEKYRPKTMKQILGQQGDKSNAKKLYNWLMNWHKNQNSQVKRTKPSPWAKNDDGAFFKAALLSGAPGIGKTTTVQVVCNELHFDLVEFNASDTRSKRLLREEVSELLSNTTLKGYFQDAKNNPCLTHVLLMDEVDGMAGNEDRGGLQELISLIKSTNVPIVCICNDRNNPKMRTLSNYVFDLKFTKPRLEQIRGAMKSICFKENITISNEDLDRLIESTDQDIRQVINHLALFVGKTGTQEKSEKKHVNKDLRLGPWDVVRKVFSAEEHKHMSIHDKSDLFFHDYNISPLFVQENYLIVVPKAPKNELLERLADSAESIALGDIIETSIRSKNAWSLLPAQACCSCVVPGTLMSGHIAGQISFPSWLGRNSRTNKFDRLMQEITMHSRLTTGVSKEAIKLDYIKPLRDAIVRPLTENVRPFDENIDAAVEVMNQYHLLREDLDSLIEISLWPGDRDPMQIVDSKMKASFTRAYNKSSIAMPYTVTGGSKKKTTSNVQDEDLLEQAEEASSDENDDNVDADKMIKAKKSSTNKKADPKVKIETKGKSEAKGKSSSSNPPKNRGKGRGKTK